MGYARLDHNQEEYMLFPHPNFRIWGKIQTISWSFLKLGQRGCGMGNAIGNVLVVTQDRSRVAVKKEAFMQLALSSLKIC